MKAKKQVWVLVALCAVLGGAECCIQIMWSIGDGAWSNGMAWVPVAPAGIVEPYSCVTIDGSPPAVVTLDASPAIQSLTLGRGAELQVVSGGLDPILEMLDASGFIQNAGILRASQAGQLILSSPTITLRQGGVIEVVDSPAASALSFVQLGVGNEQVQVRVIGGTLRTDGPTDIILLTSGVTISDVTIETLRGALSHGRPPAGCLDLDCLITSGVVIPDGDVARFEDQVNNHGLITIAAVTADTRLEPTEKGTPTLIGRGRVELVHPNYAMLGSPSGLSYINGTGHTVAGTGRILDGLDNQGRIVADDTGGLPLLMDGGVYFNKGEIAAENGGLLRIQNQATIDQDSGARIVALSGGDVEIQNTEIDPFVAGVVAGTAAAIGGILTLNEVQATFDLCFNGPPPAVGIGVMQPTQGGNIDIQTKSMIALVSSGATAVEITAGNYSVVNSVLNPKQDLLIEPQTTRDGSMITYAVPVNFSLNSNAMLKVEGGLEILQASGMPAVRLNLLDSTLEVQGNLQVRAQGSDPVSLDFNASTLDAKTTRLSGGTTLMSSGRLVVAPQTAVPPNPPLITDYVRLDALETSMAPSGQTVEISADTLEVYDPGRVQIEGTVVLKDELTFTVTDEDDFVWAEDSRLQFNNTNGIATMEAGGDPARAEDPDGGFEGNFSLGKLVVAANTEVKLVDVQTNSVGMGNEALFIDDADIQGTLTCNGIEVFCLRCRTVDGLPSNPCTTP